MGFFSSFLHSHAYLTIGDICTLSSFIAIMSQLAYGKRGSKNSSSKPKRICIFLLLLRFYALVDNRRCTQLPFFLSLFLLFPFLRDRTTTNTNMLLLRIVPTEREMHRREKNVSLIKQHVIVAVRRRKYF